VTESPGPEASGGIVTPDTILRWRRWLISRRWTFGREWPGRPGIRTEISPLNEDWSILRGMDLSATDDFTGEFIRKTGPSRDSDFLYSALQYTF
jgi:hypothetical protein